MSGWAIVRDGQIVQSFNNPKAITMPDSGVQHPRSIFFNWSKEELNAIGVYAVEVQPTPIDSRTQRIKNEQTVYDAQQNKVIRTNTVVDLPLEQIKERFIYQWNQQAHNLLKETDWKIIREVENVGRPAGANVKWWRNEIRLHVNTIEAGLEACTTVQEVRDYLDILPEWPKLEDYTPPGS